MDFEIQESFVEVLEPWSGMPSTRFQGSKKKLLPSLNSVFSGLDFKTCLDAFGGTGSVSFLLKQMGKSVTYNDVMPSSVVMAKALFVDGPVEIDEKTLLGLFNKKSNFKYRNVIQSLYKDIYFTDEENVQIDIFCQNVAELSSEVVKNEAFYLLAQSLLSKRPYNLFHRANLHMRTKEVERSFGNKATWDKPIVEHCLKFLKELRVCRARKGKYPMRFENKSAFDVKASYDLVYIDTPYAKSKGTQESNYFNFYHFLDALLAYDEIEKTVKLDVKHKPFYEFNKSWYPANDIDAAFCKLFSQFKNSKLVISYRSDGFPSVERLTEILGETHGNVQVNDIGNYKYVLSTQQSDTKEIVIVAQPEAQ